MTQALQGIVAFFGLVAVLGVGYFVWRTAAARVNGEAATTWRSIAEAYEAKLELKDSQVADMRADHARIEGEMKAQIDGLRAIVDEMKKRDQLEILGAIAEHERSAGVRADVATERHREALEVWQGIRDDLRAILPTGAA